MRIDRDRNAFTVVTPRTCGGSVEFGGRIDADLLRVKCEGGIATVFATAMDAKPLAVSEKILVTHLTRLYNTGDRFADRTGNMLLAYGKPPYLLARGTATVALKLDHPEKYVVHALESNGERRGIVPSTVLSGALVFKADVSRDPANATYLYEIGIKAGE